jgi:hypothetical protein
MKLDEYLRAPNNLRTLKDFELIVLWVTFLPLAHELFTLGYALGILFF